MNTFLTLLLSVMLPFGTANSETLSDAPQVVAQEVGSDFQITSDEVKDGVRYVSATPSAKVCSKRIDIQIDVKTATIKHCEFFRGCPGNALGLCSLLEGMKVKDAIAKLRGINCAGRGTSCPDQLARVLEQL